MPTRPSLKLSILRDIGWREWDPIGLQSLEGGWQQSTAADEYDSYLIHVAVRLQNGEADKPNVDYLLEVESQHMGLGGTSTATTRARATVAAIREYVRDLT